MDLLAESRKSGRPNYSFTECGMNSPTQKGFVSKSTYSSSEDISLEEPSSTEYAFTSASVEMAPVTTMTSSVSQRVHETNSTVPTENSAPSTPSDRNDSLIVEAGSDLSDNETKELLNMLDLAMEVSRTESTNLGSNSDSSLSGEILTPVKPSGLQLKTLPFSPLQKPAVETTLLDETAIVSADQSSYLKSVFTSACDSLVADEEETSEEKDEKVVTVRDVAACGQRVMSESDEMVVLSEEDTDSIDREVMRGKKSWRNMKLLRVMNLLVKKSHPVKQPVRKSQLVASQSVKQLVRKTQLVKKSHPVKQPVKSLQQVSQLVRCQLMKNLLMNQLVKSSQQMKSHPLKSLMTLILIRSLRDL